MLQPRRGADPSPNKQTCSLRAKPACCDFARLALRISQHRSASSKRRPRYRLCAIFGAPDQFGAPGHTHGNRTPAKRGEFFFFKQKTAYEIMPSLVGSEMCIRDRKTEYSAATTARFAVLPWILGPRAKIAARATPFFAGHRRTTGAGPNGLILASVPGVSNPVSYTHLTLPTICSV